MRVIPLVALCLTLGQLGCSPAPTKRTMPPDDAGLPNPAMTLTEEHDGRDIVLNRGDAFLIKLKGDGDKDSFWGVRKTPDSVEFLAEEKGDAELHFEFLFRLKESGPVTVEFAKFHEDRAEKKKEYKVNLKVR